MWVQVQVSYGPSQVTFYVNALNSAKFRKIGEKLVMNGAASAEGTSQLGLTQFNGNIFLD